MTLATDIAAAALAMLNAIRPNDVGRPEPTNHDAATAFGVAVATTVDAEIDAKITAAADA